MSNRIDALLDELIRRASYSEVVRLRRVIADAVFQLVNDPYRECSHDTLEKLRKEVQP